MGEGDAAIVALSAKVALTAIIFGIVPAFAVAWVLARGRFRGKSILQAVITLPLVLPPVVTGYGLLLLFGKYGPVGSLMEHYLGVVFAFRWTGAALAAAVMSFPLMVRPIQLSIEAADPGLEDAARTLGASRSMTFLTVLLPLALPGVIAGAILAFARAIGEFGATITFVANIPGETQTMSLAIYSLLQSPTGDADALKLILLSIVLSVVAIVASEWLAWRLARKHR
ncbi:MAG: molybdate ABC transporter permease subunit [Rhizobiaceae bacterium]